MIVHPGELETDDDAVEILLQEDLPRTVATVVRSSWCANLAESLSHRIARQLVQARFADLNHASTRLLAEYVLSLVAHSIIVVDRDVWIRFVCPQHADCLMGGSLYVGPPLSEDEFKTVRTTYGLAGESELAEFIRTTFGCSEYFRGVGMFCPDVVLGSERFRQLLESVGQSNWQNSIQLFNTLSGEMVAYQSERGVARIRISTGEAISCAENLLQFTELFVDANSQGRCLDWGDLP